MIGILIISFLILALIRMPIAIGLGIATLLAIILTGDIPLASIPHKMVNGLDSYVFIAIPLFLFAGRLMNAGGITDRLFRFARVLVGTISGGLAHANVMAGMFFSAISGSAVATVGGLGEIEMKAMRENGYDDDFAASVAIASSVLGPVIPPSIPLIIYASMTDNSVGKLFLGGVIPGILLAFSLMILIYIISKRRKYPKDKKPGFKKILKATGDALIPLLMPIIMLGGIYSGIFTPTEAAAVAGLYALFISVYIYETIKWKDLPKILVETMITTAVVTLVISATSGFSFILSIKEAGDSLINFISGITDQKIVVLLIINVLLLIFGAVMEAGVVLILFIPVLSAKRDTHMESDLITYQSAGGTAQYRLMCASDAPYGRQSWNFGGFRAMFETLLKPEKHTDPRLRENPTLFNDEAVRNYLGGNYARLIIGVYEKML